MADRGEIVVADIIIKLGPALLSPLFVTRTSLCTRWVTEIVPAIQGRLWIVPDSLCPCTAGYKSFPIALYGIGVFFARYFIIANRNTMLDNWRTRHSLPFQTLVDVLNIILCLGISTGFHAGLDYLAWFTFLWYAGGLHFLQKLQGFVYLSPIFPLKPCILTLYTELVPGQVTGMKQLKRQPQKKTEENNWEPGFRGIPTLDPKPKIVLIWTVCF